MIQKQTIAIKPIEFDKYGLPTRAVMKYRSGRTKEISMGDYYLRRGPAGIPVEKSDIHDYRSAYIRRQDKHREIDAAERLGYDKNAWLKYCRENGAHCNR